MVTFKLKLTGRVLSNKMTKTVVVEVVRRVKHPVLNKYFTKRKKYKAHDEKGAGAGDIVMMKECAPISKEKHWVVVEIVEKALI